MTVAALVLNKCKIGMQYDTQFELVCCLLAQRSGELFFLANKVLTKRENLNVILQEGAAELRFVGDPLHISNALPEKFVLDGRQCSSFTIGRENRHAGELRWRMKYAG